MPVWPELTLDQYRSLVEDLRPDFTNSVDDILTHVLFHSAYHRGQIALEIRLGGGAPAYTDFIYGVRLGLVE